MLIQLSNLIQRIYLTNYLSISFSTRDKKVQDIEKGIDFYRTVFVLSKHEFYKTSHFLIDKRRVKNS